MDGFWTMIFLGQEDPGLFKLLWPLLALIAVSVFRWLNEKSKQQERQQQAEDETGRQGGDEDRTFQAVPEQSQRPQRVPLPPQGKRIVVARDLSVEASQSQLRAEAVRQARVLQASRSGRAVGKKAKVVRSKTVEPKASRQLPSPKAALPMWGQAISPSQIRRAIVWAEIVGAPRALRPYKELF